MQNGTIKKDSGRSHNGKKGYTYRMYLTVFGCVILLIFSPWIYFLTTFQSENTTEQNLKLDHYVNEVIDKLKDNIVINATELIQEHPEVLINLTKFQVLLNDNVGDILAVNYRSYLVQEHKIEITVSDYLVKIEPIFRKTNDLVRYQSISVEDNNDLELDTVGMYYDISVPYSFLLTGTLYLSARQMKDSKNGDDNWRSDQRSIMFEEILPISNLFFEYKLQQFQNQAETVHSDLGRMMRYMLTTLTRIRINNWEGSSQIYTHKHILNEGDVELALNMAILLEEAILFRAFDKNARNSIDQYFYSLNVSEQLINPTGKRQWGNAELSNYYDYGLRKSLITEEGSRTLQKLMDKYITSGYIDPADMMALFLVLDEGSRPAVIGTPKDTSAILEERYDTQYLMDPREINDASDTTNLKFILSLPKENEDQFNLTSSSSEAWNYKNIKMQVDQQPNYLILGREFKVKGLDDPRGWYSTAGLRPGVETRTPTVVPERPEDHDYRLEWNLNIEGKFRLLLKPEQDLIRSINKNHLQEKEINFNFPINIYVWFKTKPIIDSIHFNNFNTGNALTDGWIITTESHLIEYYEMKLWKYLKPLASLGFDGVNSIAQLILSEQGNRIYDNLDRSYLDNSMTGFNIFSSNWLTDILMVQTHALNDVLEQDRNNFYSKFNIFMEYYFMDYLRQYNEEYDFFNYTSKPQFPFHMFFPWLSELGYEHTLLFNNDTKILNITVLQENGYFSLFVHGFNSTPGQLRVDLISYLELPGLIKLKTTISSESLNNKPILDANGILFNKYRLSTNAYSKPEISPDSGDISVDETNEHFLITRAKFGSLYPAAAIQLTDLIIEPDLEDINIEITLIVPEEHKDQESELEDIVSSLSWNTTSGTGFTQDKIIQEKVLISVLLDGLSEKLLKWLKTKTKLPYLAFDFSISSVQNLDHTNLTIFLTEPKSTQQFINWLGEYGLELILTLTNGYNDDILPRLASILSNDAQVLPIDDLKNIAFELYNRKLDHELQKEMNLQQNIQNIYQLPGSIMDNITLMITLTGEAMLASAKGLDIAETHLQEQNEIVSEKDQIETYFQAYYCLQPRILEDGVVRTNVLVGTSWFH